MNGPVQTSDVAPPSIALAMMAFRLAYMRVYNDPVPWRPEPHAREYAGLDGSAQAEHYRIIDRLSRGEQP